MGYDWELLPDIHEVREALFKQANLRALLKMTRLELEIYQATLTQQKPRDASVKIIGLDEESRGKLQGLLQRVLEIESELDVVDADVRFNNHRIDTAKALAYKMRI